MEKLHPGARWLFRIQSYVVLIIIGVVVGGWSFAGLFSVFGGLVAFFSSLFIYVLFIIIFSEIYTRMTYNRWLYEFTSNGLKLERGIIWKRYSNVPYQRIQNVDIHRGILARMLGFSTVNIHTAGYSGYSNHKSQSEGHIPAVSIQKANQIRQLVMKKIGKRAAV
jgi:uncharacterized protein